MKPNILEPIKGTVGLCVTGLIRASSARRADRESALRFSLRLSVTPELTPRGQVRVSGVFCRTLGRNYIDVDRTLESLYI